MEKQIVIKERVKNLPFDQIEKALDEAKSNTSKVKVTESGIRIKRLKNLLILL